jgi:hypothetical protein
MFVRPGRGVEVGDLNLNLCVKVFRNFVRVSSNITVFSITKLLPIYSYIPKNKRSKHCSQIPNIFIPCKELC